MANLAWEDWDWGQSGEQYDFFAFLTTSVQPLFKPTTAHGHVW